MSFVINGRTYSGVAGDGYKEAAKDLIASGDPHIDQGRSYVDPLNMEYIQRELDKANTAMRPFWL